MVSMPIIENILILDTETTGLDPSKGAKLIEVAAILYNLEHKAILQSFSTLFPCEENPVENINGIKPDVTKKPYPLGFVQIQLHKMAEFAGAIVAHNAEFDRKFIENWTPEFRGQKWVCTKKDFKWNVPLFRFRLQDVCEAYKVPYEDAHRAMNDCMLMVKCFNEVPDLQRRMEWAITTVGKNTFR